MELEDGARDWNRTSDLLLTKEVLYRLSYTGVNGNFLVALLPGWSGKRESNPRTQLGRLMFYH